MRMKLELGSVGRLMYKPCDVHVFVFLAGLVFIQGKYFWNRRVELDCPVASILQV